MFSPEDNDFTKLMSLSEMRSVFGKPKRCVSEDEALDFARAKASASGASGPRL